MAVRAQEPPAEIGEIPSGDLSQGGPSVSMELPWPDTASETGFGETVAKRSNKVTNGVTRAIGLGVALSCGIAAAQSPLSPNLVQRKISEIARTPTPPVLDGVLDDTAWAEATVIEDLHQYDPVDHGEPTEQSTFYLLYDDENLYIGARLLDSEIEEIDARQLIQDQSVGVDDRIEIVIDPFNNMRTGYKFQINPNGIRRDGIYEGPTNVNEDWDGIWAAEATMDDAGWSGEIAIPFKTLNFDPSNPDWGFTVGRVIPRRNEKIAWTSFNRDINPSAAGVLTGFWDLQQGLGLDVVPSLVVGSNRNHQTSVDDSFSEPSLDVRYNFTPSLTGVLTLNTDFSATEVDDRQVNLSRFSNFFPEKRVFFLQDADIFAFGGKGGAGNSNNRNGMPFFSRRIGLSDRGQPVDLETGVKLTGRAGRFNIGVLGVSQDGFEGRNGTVDPSDLFVGRISANVLAESSVGMIVTDGDPRSNVGNSLAGADFRYRNSRLESGRILEGAAWFQQSDTEGLDSDQSAFGFRIAAPASEGFSGAVEYEVFEENFSPALGFLNRENVERKRIWGSHRYRPVGHAWIRDVQQFLSFQDFRNNRTGEVETQNIFFRPARVTNHRGDQYGLMFRHEREVLTRPFEISEGVVIQPGDYTFSGVQYDLQLSGERTLAPTVEITTGEFYDGDWLQIDSSLDWRPSSRWFVGLGYQYSDIELPAGDFTTRLIRLRANLAFNARWSWVNLIQYDNVSGTAGINSRLRWNPRAGENLYIVLNHESEAMAAFSGLDSRASQFSVKYSKTFRF